MLFTTLLHGRHALGSALRVKDTMELLTPQAWDRFIEDHPEAHILQPSPWGELKSAFGWKPRYVQQKDLGALILFRR